MGIFAPWFVDDVRPMIQSWRICFVKWQQLRLRTEPNFRLIDVPCSPFLMLGYPISVVFPSNFAEQFDRDECRMAMSHELSHYVRRDLWWNTIVSFVSITLFFVPFVWFAARRYRASQELACDWLAVQQSRVDSRHYAQLLVQMVERFQHRSPSPAILSMAGSESFRTLSERLKTMKKFHEMKSHRRWLTSVPVWLLPQSSWSHSDFPRTTMRSRKRSPRSRRARFRPTTVLPRHPNHNRIAVAHRQAVAASHSEVVQVAPRVERWIRKLFLRRWQLGRIRCLRWWIRERWWLHEFFRRFHLEPF